MTFSNTYGISDISSVLGIVITVVISIISALYVILSNTKKYELSEAYRIELLNWHCDVLDTMIYIIHAIENKHWYNEHFDVTRLQYLSKLSFLAEKGRYYYPNQLTGHGKSKLSPYQGVRDASIEIIIIFYGMVKENDADSLLTVLWDLERQFNARGYDVIKPRDRIRKTLKYTYVNSKSNDSYLMYRGKTKGQF